MGRSSAQMGIRVRPHPLQSPGQRHPWLSLWFCTSQALSTIPAWPHRARRGPMPRHTLGYGVTFIRPVTHGEQPSPRVCILERDTQAPGIWPSFHRKVISPFTGPRGHDGPWRLPISVGIPGSPAPRDKGSPSPARCQAALGEWRLGVRRCSYRRPWQVREGVEEEKARRWTRWTCPAGTARWWEDGQEFKWGHGSGGCGDGKPYQV